MPGKHTKLFKRIFHGDFRPADGMDYSRAYKRWMKENYEAHQRFRKTLKKGQLEAFDELEEMDIELSGRAQEENYIAGMKAGIQLMVEAYIGQYRNFELMELLDIRHHQLITYYSDTGREYKARYLIERIEEPMRGSWAAEWDHARLKVLWDGIRLKVLRPVRKRKGQEPGWLWR